jgi:hypothetical protein
MEFEWDTNKDRGNQEQLTDDMRAEYDFSKGVRGKYYQRYRQGTNLVLPAPDLPREPPH